MFSTLRRLAVLATSAVASVMLFAPVAFAVNAGQDGNTGGPTRTSPTSQVASTPALSAWQWTLVSVAALAAVAFVVAVGFALHRRSRQAGALRPRMP